MSSIMNFAVVDFDCVLGQGTAFVFGGVGIPPPFEERLHSGLHGDFGVTVRLPFVERQ